MLLRILNLIGALALPTFVSSASCFLPDGSINATDVPCISNDGTSRCCAPDELCSSNKLCVSKADHNKFSRGSCLDKSFGSTCPNFCKGIDDGGKVTVLPCGSPSLGEFCCDDGKGFQCCATQTSILTIGIGTSFSEGSVRFTSMSAKPETATTTSFEATTSQTSADVQASLPVTSSSVAATSTSILLTTTPSKAVAASSSTVASSFVELSSVQSQTPIESQPIPSSSTPEPTFAPPQQPSNAASSSTFQIQSSVESQIPSSTFIQPLQSTTLISLSPTAASSSPLASEKLSQISSPIQLTSPIRPSSLSIIPQSIAVSSISVPPSSAATSILAGAIESDSSTSHKGTSPAVVASASVISVLFVTGLIILGFSFYSKRKAKRISKRFEASLGRTNIVNEQGPIRSGRSGLLGGFGVGRTGSGGSGGSEGNIDTPIFNSPVTSVPENAWRPQRPPRPEMVPSQASSTFRRLLYDVQSNPL